MHYSLLSILLLYMITLSVKASDGSNTLPVLLKKDTNVLPYRNKKKKRRLAIQPSAALIKIGKSCSHSAPQRITGNYPTPFEIQKCWDVCIAEDGSGQGCVEVSFRKNDGFCRTH